MVLISRFVLFLICTLIALVGMTSLVRAQEMMLTIHAVDFPPYEIENSARDGLLGYDVEVIVEAFKRVGQPAKVEFLPWTRIMNMARKGTTLAALSCAKSEDRDQYIHYSDPISTSTGTLVASKTYRGEVPRTLIDIRGMKVLVVGGYVGANELDEANVDYKTAVNDKVALRVLLNRNFDFFYTTHEFVQYVAVGLNIADRVQYFDISLKVDYHLCFSKQWPTSKALRDKFNLGLAKIRADGTYDAIHAKYQ